MSISEIVVFAVAGVMVISLVKSTSSVNTVILRLAIVCFIVAGIVPTVIQLVNALKSFELIGEMSIDSVKILLKVFVVLCSGSIVSDICRDNGENSIASVVEIASRLLAVTLCIPVITAVIGVAIGFLS